MESSGCPPEVFSPQPSFSSSMDWMEIHNLLSDHPCYDILDDHDDGNMEALLLMGADRADQDLLPEVGPTMAQPLVQDTMVVGLGNNHVMISDHLETQEDLMEVCSITDLLLKGAEAVEAMNWQLASAVVAHLDHRLLISNQENGNVPFHRSVFYFNQGLRCKILAAGATQHLSSEPVPRPTDHNAMAAYRMFQELSPCIKFAHFTANQAILEATVGERDVHIIDFDVMEGIQWPPLMIDLVMRKDASLRITMVIGSGNVRPTWQTGRWLKDFAESIGLSFSFDQVMMEKEEDLQAIKVGHAMVANCMVQQVHMFTSVKTFLRGVRKLSPKMVVLVEEEPFNLVKMPSVSFVDFFCEALHHYTAFSDSLMSSSLWGGHKVGHKLIEEFLGLRILDCLRQFPSKMEDKEFWGYGFSSVKGFKDIPMSGCNVSQAKILVGIFGGGYWVQHEKCRLSLCWKARPLTTASIWVPT